MTSLSSIDPQWAWQPYQPSEQAPWDLAAAAHLYRRAAFGATGEQLQTAANSTVEATVDQLLNLSASEETFDQQMQPLTAASLATGNPRRLSAVWVYRMLHSPTPLLEKMTLFWHGHFATSAEKVEDPELMLQQHQLLRRLALGNFPELLLEISRDPAMLIYLDSASNRKSHPNENFARELMELFSMGEGNYSEQDIRELARCFTGWEVKRKEFRFNRYQFDSGSKSVLGQSGRFRGEDAVAIVADHSATPMFIADKLIRFFVLDEPAPPAELVQPLADQLRRSEMSIAAAVRQILTSNLFHSPMVRGQKIRSPADFAIGFLRAVDGSTDAYALAAALEQLGQGLFYPPSVKGWDGGRTWINSSTLVGRSNLIRRLLSDEKTRFARTSLAAYFSSQGVHSAEKLIDWFESTLMAVPLPPAARSQAVALYANGGDRKQQIASVLNLLATLPQFQLA